MSKFCECLKQARVNANLTQEQLGNYIGKDKIFICHLENNYCLPNLEDLYKICEILKVTPKELHYTQVITPKIEVATAIKLKPRVNAYEVHFYANRSDFPELTKPNLKKCGYRGLRDIFKTGYKMFVGELRTLEKTLLNGRPVENWEELERVFERSKQGEIKLYSRVDENTNGVHYLTKPQC